MSSENRFAILIDGDNISPTYIKTILDEISTRGTATYKRIYGDWTSPTLASWKEILLKYSITPMQQYSYTVGKNSTDSAMIIDAMDILYSGKVDGFCLATSDSDFTKLASRLRESGMIVVGMGEEKTPRPFVAACDEFKFVDKIAKGQKPVRPAQQNAPNTANAAKDSKKQNTAKEPIVTLRNGFAAKPKQTPPPAVPPVAESASEERTSQTDLETIKNALVVLVNEKSDDEGYMPVSEIGNILSKRYTDFDVRNFGFSKMVSFLESLGLFDVKKVPDLDNKKRPNAKIAYLKLKD